MHRGGFARLATLRPTEGPPVWTTLVTGRLPRDHGIRSGSFYRLLGSATDWALLPRATTIGALERAGLVTRRPVPSTARRCRALWNVLDAFGISSGVVRVWGTHPPEAIRGFVVSPYFHLLLHDPERAATAIHPRDLLREVSARAVEPAQVDPALLRELAEPRPPGAPLQDPALHRLAENSLAPDLTYERAADVLRQAYDPSLVIVAFHGYDIAGHEFYRYAHPEAFGNVDPEEARRYGGVLGGYATLLARWVGELEKGLRPGDLLVVLSGHGLAPTPLWRRLLGVLTGTETPTAGHGAAPPGVLVIAGEGIRPGSRSASATLLDVTPTLLYLMGLPVARDMEGRVLSELVDSQYARDHPVTFIPSYESLAVAPAAARLASSRTCRRSRTSGPERARGACARRACPPPPPAVASRRLGKHHPDGRGPHGPHPLPDRPRDRGAPPRREAARARRRAQPRRAARAAPGAPDRARRPGASPPWARSTSRSTATTSRASPRSRSPRAPTSCSRSTAAPWCWWTTCCSPAAPCAPRSTS